MADLKIVFPRANAERNPFPATFVTAGSIGPLATNQKISSVKAFVTLFKDGKPEETPVEMAETCLISPSVPNGRKEGNFVRWVIRFKDVVASTQQVRLTLKAFGVTPRECIASQSVDVWLTPPRKFTAPGIDWPPSNPYTLETDEEGYFYCCGSSDYPITGITFHGMSRTNGDWSSGDLTWWGEFFNLGTTPGNGEHVLSVTNTQDTTNYDITIS